MRILERREIKRLYSYEQASQGWRHQQSQDETRCNADGDEGHHFADDQACYLPARGADCHPDVPCRGDSYRRRRRDLDMATRAAGRPYGSCEHPANVNGAT